MDVTLQAINRMLSTYGWRKKMGEFEVKKETKYEVNTHDVKDDVKEGAKDAKGAHMRWG